MSYIAKALKISVDGGYNYTAKTTWHNSLGHNGTMCLNTILVDPDFWKGLSKAEKWKEPENDGHFPEAEVIDIYQTGWNARAHLCLDHKLEGKDMEIFFKELLNL